MTQIYPSSKIAIILPPREMFSPSATGAVGLLVKMLARPAAGFLPVVYGMPTADPFFEVAFRPVRPALLPFRLATRYAIGLVKALEQDLPDLIEVHNRPDIALRLAAHFERIPVVLFLHNDPQGMNFARSAKERDWLINEMASVVPVSAYLQSRLLEGIETPYAAGVFPNFVDLDAMPRPAPQKRILFAGRVVGDKGADSFVAACALALPRLPGWHAQMIGADRFGLGSKETPFLRALRPKAHAANVVMTGWRPHAEVIEAMAGSAIVVVPSRWPEPFGLTALEAMACGAALLCAPNGGLIEVMGDAALPIDPEDPISMADAIVAVASDEGLRARLSAAGLARAVQFDVSHASIRLEALRKAVLAAWRAPSPRPI